MKALLIGATGATGKDLVEQILKDDDFTELHVFVRKQMIIEDPKMTVHIIDFDSPESWANLVEGDVAFSCLGTTLKAAGSTSAQRKIDVDYQYHFAQAAKNNNVDDFILVSAANANPNSPVFYSKIKGELEEKIKALGFLKLTIFQPGMLDRKNSDRKTEVIGNEILKTLNSIGILKHQRPLPTETLAKAMINASKIKSNGESIIRLSTIFNFAEK